VRKFHSPVPRGSILCAIVRPTPGWKPASELPAAITSAQFSGVQRHGSRYAAHWPRPRPPCPEPCGPHPGLGLAPASGLAAGREERRVGDLPSPHRPGPALPGGEGARPPLSPGTVPRRGAMMRRTKPEVERFITSVQAAAPSPREVSAAGGGPRPGCCCGAPREGPGAGGARLLPAPPRALRGWASAVLIPGDERRREGWWESAAARRFFPPGEVGGAAVGFRLPEALSPAGSRWFARAVHLPVAPGEP